MAIAFLFMCIAASAQESPKLAVRFFVGDSVLSTREGDVPNLKIRVVANGHPDDSYTIRSWSLFLRRGTDLGSPIRGSGESLRLTNTFLHAGDVIAIDIDTIIHTDASGNSVKVALTADMKHILIAAR